MAERVQGSTKQTDGGRPRRLALPLLVGALLMVAVPALVARFSLRVAPPPAEMASPALEGSFPPRGPSLTDYRRAMSEQLEGLGWVDRDAKIAHIPIEQAMSLLLERGLPARTQPAKEEAQDR